MYYNVQTMFKKLWTNVFKPSPRGMVRWRLFFVVVLALASGVFVYPQAWNKVVERVPQLPKITEQPFHLGLDLAGGAHLVYEADLSNITESERDQAMSGVRDVIERRVNAFGVAEPIVQTARSGESWRLVVELAGIKDVKEAIKQIGETPVLEFKEESIPEPTRALTADETRQMNDFNKQSQKRGQEALNKLKAQDEIDFMALAREYSDDLSTKEMGGSLGFITYNSAYRDLWNVASREGAGKIITDLVETAEGWNILRISGEEDRGKEVHARHLLLCYRGIENCAQDISEDDALKKIKELKQQATPDNFEELARANSIEPNVAQSGGDLGWFSEGMMVKPFEEVIFTMADKTISEPVKTQFGYHLIYKIEERPQKAYDVARILFKKKTSADYLPASEPWRLTQLSGKHLAHATLQFDQNTGFPQVGLEFNSEGKDLFAAITTRNVNKLVAIFLDGYPISVPRVQNPIIDGQAVITGNFTLQEAKLLVQRLNAGALPVPVNLISQRTVGATLGNASIMASLKAGLVGFAMVAIFMILYYRLAGLLSVVSLVVYTGLVLSLFKFIPVTLTLSGIAGFILSIGMAVDANVLIFERMKEELRAGKPIAVAVEDGFERAWLSIRDSNYTTLFAALVFFWFSTSLVKGFGLTLSIGIVISMFSALWVTRIFLRMVAPYVKKPGWYGTRVMK